MIVTFFYLLFSAFVICQPIPPSDPAYYYHYQEFRKSPNLDVFIAPYPLMASALPISRFLIDKKNTVFRIAPNLRLSNHRPDFRVGGWLAGEWDNISLLAEPTIVNKFYASETIGRAYERGNISGRFSNAFIAFSEVALAFSVANARAPQDLMHSIICSLSLESLFSIASRIINCS